MKNHAVKTDRSALRSARKERKQEEVRRGLSDTLMIMAFNAISKAVRLPPRVRFQFPVNGKVSIGDCRRIVKTWSPQSYRPGLTTQEFDVPRVLSSFFDRYISQDESMHRELLEAKAAVKFIRTNSDGDAIDSFVLNTQDLKPVIERMQNIIGGLFQDRLNVVDLYSSTGHGPNGTTTIARKDAYLHIKDRDISGTQASLQQFHHYLLWDTQLRDSLVDGSSELRAAINGHNVSLGTVVNCTKTGFVDKSFEDLRTMCPETNCVGFFATMIASVLTAILRSIGIDLNTQPDVHRRLAKLGSLYPNLFIGTIDWSQASDRIWLSLVETVFSKAHPSWFSFMSNVCRHQFTSLDFKVFLGHEFTDEEELETFLIENCESYSIQRRKQGDYLKVSCIVRTTMFATMGNPLTFPLQTLIFYAFLLSVTELAEEQQDPTERQVYHFPSSFGDDGIVDVRAFPLVQHYAVLLGWKLNISKSFVEGGFRESCGGDFYQGRPCRPFSPKRPPLEAFKDTPQGKRQLQAWTYIVANSLSQLLTDMGFMTFSIEEFLLEAHALCKFGKVCLVPPSYPDGSGYRVSSTIQWNGLSHFRSHLTIEPGSTKVNSLLDLDFCDDSQIPSTLRGLGIETPTVDAFARSPMGLLYHWPHFSWVERAFVFKCIVSQPSIRPLEDEWVEDHYYINGLKTADRVKSNDYAQIHVSKSFFDIDVKGMAKLTQDGSLTNKECRLYKTTNTVTLWA